MHHLWIFCCLLGGCAGGEPLQRFEFTRVQMGVQARIVLYAADRDAARDAAATGFAEIARLDGIMSDYRVSSEVMRLCAQPAGTPVPISHDLFAVLRAAHEMAAATQGAFDVTAGPLTGLWREARSRGIAPTEHQILAALQRVNWRHLTLDAAPSTAELEVPGMALDLGGIAKGYAADRARQVLCSKGHPRCLVALAGDIAAGDPPPGRAGWRIAIASAGTQPPRSILLRNMCVSTSGDLEQFIEIDGQRYSHIIDPRTGFRTPHQLTATVIAREGAIADALASALCVEPLLLHQLVSGFQHTAAIIRTVDDEAIQWCIIDPRAVLRWDL